MKTEKLYDKNAYLRNFTAKVLSCEPLADAKKRTDDAAYAVILDRTAFFPEGGGQTADTGNLGNAVVCDVQEIDGEIVHLVDVPLPVGEELAAELDWEVRFRKMQNHTGEHLISGIVHSQFGYDNVGFHLGTDGVTVDFSGVLTASELEFVEYIANRVVGLNVPVTVSYPTPEECAVMEYRSKLDLTENVRIVTIEGWDVCACCAPHVTHTGAVGGIKILSCENWKGGVRIRMLCGLDARDDYQKRLTQTVRISNLLSCKQLEAADAVERLMKQSQAEREESAKLRRALLDSKIAALHETDGNLVIFDDLLDNNNLRNLVNAGVPLCGGVCAAFQGNDTDGYRYIIGSQSVKLRAWAKEFNSALSGRGGGSEEMIQGTVTAKAEDIRAYLGDQVNLQ
ncbi:MAG: alanyl-tRNA editing protein [Oscillospiraceae bacterium]|nr:alanyl-tRNA editing protein [Oscillospiraceae bacterium]MBQ9905426.1 alanyl-tRNA editing protein [Oscillospiraceae bacterium]